MAGGGNCGSKNEGPPIDNDLALRRAIELQQQNKGEIVIINTGRKRFVELGTLARIVYLYLIVCHFLMLFFNIVISLVSIFRKSKYQIISDRHFYWLHFLYTIGVGCWWGFMVTGFLRRKDNLLLFTTLSVLALFFILIDFLFDLRLIYHAVRQDFTVSKIWHEVELLHLFLLSICRTLHWILWLFFINRQLCSTKWNVDQIIISLQNNSKQANVAINKKSP